MRGTHFYYSLSKGTSKGFKIFIVNTNHSFQSNLASSPLNCSTINHVFNDKQNLSLLAYFYLRIIVGNLERGLLCFIFLLVYNKAFMNRNLLMMCNNAIM